MSQQEIARLTHQSRTNVSRLLRICEEEGIVVHMITKSSNKRVSLENQLTEKFGLLKAIVVPSSSDEQFNQRRVSIQAGMYLNSILHDNMLIGVVWGSMVYETIRHFNSSRPYHIDVIQCVGGIASKTTASDGQLMTKMLADHFNGETYLIDAPLIVASRKTRDLLLQEPVIKQHFKRVAESDIILMGIGNNDEQSSLVRSGNLDLQEIRSLMASDAVADICGTGIAADGSVAPTLLNDRVISIAMNVLKKIPVRIASVCGERKVMSTLCVLKGQYINVLVTDETTAEELLQTDL